MSTLSIPNCTLEATFDRPSPEDPSRQVTITIDVYEWRVKWDRQLERSTDTDQSVQWFQDAFLAAYEPHYHEDALLTYSEAYNLLKAVSVAFDEFKKKFAHVQTSFFGTDSNQPSSSPTTSPTSSTVSSQPTKPNSN